MEPHDPTFWERQEKISIFDLLKKDHIMKRFIGVKVIMGKPMTLGEYNKYRGWKMPENEVPNKFGYLVEYPPDPTSEKNHPDHEGYISWSPKEVFDKAYREISSMTFGLALEALKKGLSVKLPAWKDDVKIKMQFPDENSKMTAPYLYVESRFGCVPWKETMIELLSDDWIVVE